MIITWAIRKLKATMIQKLKHSFLSLIVMSTNYAMVSLLLIMYRTVVDYSV
jgi:hypothetical protein